MEECLNIASSIEVSCREPGPHHAGVQRVGRRKRPPAVFALGLSLTWVNTQVPAGIGTGCPRGWWCRYLPAQPSLAAGTWPGDEDGVCRALGTRWDHSQPSPRSRPVTSSTFAPIPGPLLGGLCDDDVPVLLQTPEPEARGRMAPFPPRAVLPTDRLAGERSDRAGKRLPPAMPGCPLGLTPQGCQGDTRGSPHPTSPPDEPVAAEQCELGFRRLPHVPSRCHRAGGGGRRRLAEGCPFPAGRAIPHPQLLPPQERHRESVSPSCPSSLWGSPRAPQALAARHPSPRRRCSAAASR